MMVCRSEPTELDATFAADFLRSFDPDGRHNIVAIPPDGSPIGRTFEPGEWDAIESFVETHNGKANLYFSVNEPRAGAPDDKLADADIAAARAIHVDIDAAAGADPAAERRAAGERLAHAPVPPTYIIDSGGGLQAFWKLAEKIPLDDPNALRALNDAAGASLDGDPSVKNVGRIMRLATIDSQVKEGKEELRATCKRFGFDIDAIVSYRIDIQPIEDKIASLKTDVKALELASGKPVSDDTNLSALSSVPDLRAAYQFLAEKLKGLQETLSAPQRRYQRYVQALSDVQSKMTAVMGKRKTRSPVPLEILSDVFAISKKGYVPSLTKDTRTETSFRGLSLKQRRKCGLSMKLSKQASKIG